jgi:hypothetical protein
MIKGLIDRDLQDGIAYAQFLFEQFGTAKDMEEKNYKHMWE